MECFLQYWDNLDDLYFAVAAQRERFRRLLGRVLTLSFVGIAALAGYVSAQNAPTDALLVSALLTLLLLTGFERRHDQESGYYSR